MRDVDRDFRTSASVVNTRNGIRFRTSYDWVSNTRNGIEIDDDVDEADRGLADAEFEYIYPSTPYETPLVRV